MRSLLPLGCALLTSILTTSGAWAANGLDFRWLAPTQGEQATDAAAALGAMASFHPMAPVDSYGVPGFEVGVDFGFSNATKLDPVYGGATSPTFLQYQLHGIVGLPANFDVGFMYGGLFDLKPGFVTQPTDGTSFEVESAAWSRYGLEVRWAGLEEGVVTPAVSTRLALAYAGANRAGLPNLTVLEADAFVGKTLLLVEGRLGLGGMLIFPSYNGGTEGSSVIPSFRTTIGLSIPLLIFRILVEADWIDFNQMNILGKIALYW